MSITLPTLAISVRQPWAARILHGGKDIENRDWSTRVRGDVMIHAGKAFDTGFVDDWSDPLSEYMLRGGIVGIVEIVDCIDRRPAAKSSRMGYTYTVRNPRPIPLMPCRGVLGFFRPSFEKAPT